MSAPLLPHDEFASLAAGLFWRADTEVVMLFAYFDESGEFDKANPKAGEVQMSLGGCLASEDAWKSFSAEWQAALPAEMEMFHMNKFEARRDVCAEWDQARRNEFLNGLLDIMGRHAIQFFGFSNRIEGSEDQFRDGYREGVLSTIFEVTGCAKSLGEEKIAIVFSNQPNFSLSRIEKVLGEINHEDTRLISTAMANPRSVRPLQAADIVAYETMCFHRNIATSLLESRYPLRKLGKYGKGIALQWALRSTADKKIDPHLRFDARDQF